MFLVTNLGVPLAVTYILGRDIPYVKDVVHGAAKALWRGVSESDFAQDLARQGRQVVIEKATEAVTQAIAQKPNASIETLLKSLTELQAKIEEYENSGADGAMVPLPDASFQQEQRAQAIALLTHLTEHKTKILGRIELNSEMIGHLSQSLGTNPPDLTLISEHLQQTVEFLNVVKDAQTGIGRKILGPEVTDKLLSSTQKPDASIQNLLKALETLLKSPVLESEKGKEEKEIVFEEKAHAKAFKAYTAFMLRSAHVFTGENYEEFKALCETISEPLSDNRFTADQMDALQQVIEFLQTLSTSQAGYLEKAKTVLESFSMKKILSAIGITNPDRESLSKIHEKSKKAQREALKRINRVKEKEVPPLDLKVSLEKKIDNIGDLSFKMILTQLIFNNESWKETFNRICKDVENRENTDAGSKDEAFFRAVDHQFTLLGLSDSFVNRARKWFYLNIAAPAIKSYLEHAIAAIKTDLIQFLEMTPKNKIQNVFKIVLNPLNAHMTQFSTFVPTLRGKVVDSYDKQIEAHFDTFIDTKLSLFAHTAIEKYAYSISLINLRYNLNAIVSMGAAVITAVSFIKGYRTSIKVAGIMTTYLFSGAFEAMLNLGVKYVAKWKLREAVKKDFLTTDPAHGKVHSRLQHILNEQLLEKLIDFNASGADISSKPMKLTSSPTTQVEMDTIVRQLFATIPLSLASTTSDAFHNHFDQPNISEKMKAEFFSIIRLFSPSISLEILKRMENLLSDEKTLSEFVWHALNSIEKSLTSEAKATDATQMDTTETQLVEHLEMAVEKVVEQGVKLALDPSKKLQDEINGTLEHIKGHIDVFIPSFGKMNAENFAEKNHEFLKLCPAFVEATTKFKGTPKIEPHCTGLLVGFMEVTTHMTSGMKQIETLLQKRNEDQEKLKVLMTIRDRLKYKKADGAISFDAKKNMKTLEILSEKRWLTDDLKAKINLYKECLETYTRTKTDTPLTEIIHRWTDDFLTHLGSEMEKLEQNITRQTQDIEENIAQLKELEIGRLADWAAKQLKPMKIRSKDVASRVATLIEGIPVERYASPLIKYFIRELLRYKNKPYHWKGIISNVAAAYGSTEIRA